jgi:hypothetical protein
MPARQASAHHRRVTLLVKPTGRVQGLYTEALDLAKLGRLTLRRISRIEFNHRRQRWQVLTPRGRRLFTSASRQRCLDWEQAHFGVKP